VAAAIQFQEQAVSLAREKESREQGVENRQTLAAQLVNLAQYYGKAEQHEEAVAFFEEALKVGEESRHPQVDVIRQMLEAAKNAASLSPEERAQLQNANQSAPAGGGGEQDDFESQLQAQLAGLPPEQRAEAEAQIRKAYAEFQRMSPEEQAAVLDGQRRAQVENAVEQIRAAGVAYFRKQVPKRDVLQMLEGASRQIKQGESAGSPWLPAAALCDCVIALIKEEPVPPVPSAYAGQFAAVQSEMK
jgi:hypothetical protein